MSVILQNKVMRVLSSAAAKRINFHLGSINVDAAGLAAIHNLVATTVIQTNIVKPVPGADAQYNNGANSLEFPREGYGADSVEEAAIVHECIHALHDFYGGGSYSPRIAGSRFTPRSENEAAAYVAGSLYHLYVAGTPLTGAAVFDVSGVIARRVMNTPGAFVTEAEARALRIAIVNSYVGDEKVYKYEFHDLTAADGP